MTRSLQRNPNPGKGTSQRATKLPPGPRGIPGLGIAPQLARDIYGYLPSVARKYGDVARLPVPGQDLILVSHPDHVHHVMTRNSSGYGKGAMNMELIDGEDHAPLPVADGEQWKRMRRLLSPKFTAQSMQELSDKVVDDIIRHLDDTWDPAAASGSPVDLEDNLATMALSVLLRGACSQQDLDDNTIARLAEEIRSYALYAGSRMVMHSMPAALPRPFAKRGKAARHYLDEFAVAAINDRITNPRPDTDMISLILEARFEDGSPMTVTQLKSELGGLIFGGFETTSSALAWTFTLLAQHPDVEARARAEVDALGLLGRKPGYADLAQLPFIRACFDESMRIQGGPMYLREALAEDEIGGYRIPKGATVIVSPTVLHNDPRFWNAPQRFHPDRFLTDKIDKNAFIPFNIGQRKCLGYQMAYMEAIFTIALVLGRFRLQLPAGFELRPAFRVSTGIKGGVAAKITDR